MSWPTSEQFWAESRAWASGQARRTRSRSQRADAQRARSMVRPDMLMVRQAEWTSRTGVVVSGAPQTGEGIHVSPQLSKICADMMAAVAPALARAFDTHLGRLAHEAWKAWPVRSGYSKSMLSLEYEQTGGEYFTGRIVSYAEYTQFIKDQPFRTLIDQRGPAVISDIASSAIDQLSAGPEGQP